MLLIHAVSQYTLKLFCQCLYCLPASRHLEETPVKRNESMLMFPPGSSLFLFPNVALVVLTLLSPDF